MEAKSLNQIARYSTTTHSCHKHSRIGGRYSWSHWSTAIGERGRSSHTSTMPQFDSASVSHLGHSQMSWITHLGGAGNALSITETSDEIWVSTFWLFRVFTWFYDLEHRIPLENVTNVERNGSRIALMFVDNDNVHHTLTLRLQKPEQFERSVRSLSGRGSGGRLIVKHRR